MARIDLPDGFTLYDDIEDLRGNQMQKNVEKAHGPHATWADGTPVWLCPLCKCNKSFDPETPNKQGEHCDGECPCHDA